MSSSLIENSAFNLSYRGFNVLYPLITTAYISHIFLAEGVGQIAFAINIVTYFTLAASLGIPNYAVKVLARVRNNSGLLNRRFSELAAFILVSSVLAALLYAGTVMLVFRGDELKLNMAIALVMMVVSNIFYYDWLFESVEDFRYLAYRSITIKVVALVLMFLTVKTRDDILIYCYIFAGITVANNLWNLASFRRYAHYVSEELDIRQHLGPVFTLFAAAFATEVYTLLDSTMLGVMCPPEYLGYYSNASRVVRASFGLVFAAIAVFNPRLNYLYHSDSQEAYKKTFQRFYNVGMYIAIPAAAALFMLAPLVMTLMFGDSFTPGILTLRMLSCLIIVFTLASVFGHIGLIIYGKEKVILVAAVTGAVLNFTMNRMLIPLYMHQGAAVASLISECVVTLLLVTVSLKCCKIELMNRNIALLALLSVMLCVGCVLI